MASTQITTTPDPTSHFWFKHPLALAITSFTVMFFLLSMLVLHILKISQKETNLEMDYWAKAFETKLQGRIDANLAIGYALEAQISVLGQIDQDTLNQIAPRLFSNTLNIRHIALAPDLIVNALYPLAGNEGALGLDYRTHPEQKAAVLEAITQQRVILAGPISLVQNSSHYFIARFPIYQKDGSPWGVISMIIDIPSLLRDAGLHDMLRRYDIALRIKDSPLIQDAIFGETTLFHRNTPTYVIHVPGNQWQLALSPLTSHYWRNLVYWGFTLLICLLTSCVIFYLRRYHQQREEHLTQLERITAIDPLTQLTSRYQFNEYLNQLIEECQRSNQGFTVLFIDLDHFKEINDSLGHSTGDQLLVKIAHTLRHCIRSYDLVCRQSGDEFIVVLKSVTKTSEIENRARIITSCICENRLIDGKQVSVTCSIGVAVYPTDGTDAASLIQHADLAMYESKRAGRNSLYFFNMSMRNEADRYIELTTALKTALQENQFKLYYQPIFSVKENRFTRCEALCRWPRPDGSMISPAEFIPVAEQSGIICDLGNWVMEESMKFCAELIQRGIHLNFSVNRSPQEFGSKQHTQQLIALRNRFKIPKSALTLEITESLLMGDNRMRSQNFLDLQEQDFQFSIDDFGTGYSAINYLRQYPVESIKIDRSFISELGVSTQADTLVRVLIQMAKSLNIRVVAEGVETAQQAEFLTALGCDYLQGFYFARPMPKEQFLLFIQSQEDRKIAQLSKN